MCRSRQETPTWASTSPGPSGTPIHGCLRMSPSWPSRRQLVLWLALLAGLLAALKAVTAAAPACRISEYPCRSGRCIRLDRFCDGNDDCGDNSDEPRTSQDGRASSQVQSVDVGCAAAAAGLSEGDCLLQINHTDLLSLKMSEVGELAQAAGQLLPLRVWTSTGHRETDPEALALGPRPLAALRLGACLQRVLRAQQCPVCGCSVPPPALQCARGHLLCRPCLAALPPPCLCPLCRAPLPPNIRNLLADEVYNSVVEVFGVRAGEAGRLTQRLFGDTRTSASCDSLPAPREFPELDTPRGITKILLQRLLPGRARSTGNLARSTGAPSRRSALAEDRDISRSLGTLDTVTRGSRGSSLDSLAVVGAGGSCCSLPGLLQELHQAAPGFVDESEAPSSCPAVRAATRRPALATRQLHCPVDKECQSLLTESEVAQHILLQHAQAVQLLPVCRLRLHPAPLHACNVLYDHHTWFYPKCERDESLGGLLVWCWAVGGGREVADFRVTLELVAPSPSPQVVLRLSTQPLCLGSWSYGRVHRQREALYVADQLLLPQHEIFLQVNKQ